MLAESEQTAMNGHVILTPALHDQLVGWIEKHYRDRLTTDDLRDVRLLEESRTALDELTQILQLGSIFEFQRAPA